jgi:predicted dithiol-disulfide oxidoreductase (DUF899 family)
MTITFPNESTDYRAARNALLDAEVNLRSAIEEVAAQRRALPTGGEVTDDYVFTALDGEPVKLSELFEDGKDTLMLYTFMYGEEATSPCPMCKSLIDGLNGELPHIEQHVNFAAVAAADEGKLSKLRADNGWKNVTLLSSRNTSYQQDYHGVFDQTSNSPAPMMNVFQRRDGKIHHFWGSESLFADVGGQSRHVDLLWPLWAALDLTPTGRGTDWYPAQSYG